MGFLLLLSVSPAAATQEQIVVCDQTQTSGRCDFKAQNFPNNMDVIQEAINSAPEGSYENKTTIILRGEQWRRQKFEEYLFDPGDGSQHKRKALLIISNKHVTIVPETRIVQFDGAASTNASGMAIIDGSVQLERMELSGFNMDYNCQINDLVQPCSLGHGLFVDKDARVDIKGVRFAQNEIAGINNVRGQVNVTNSLFVNNGNADIVSQGLLESGASISTIEVANSVFAKTNMYSTNPIIARQDTRVSVTNSILHSSLLALEKAHVSVKYSLFKYNQAVSDQTQGQGVIVSENNLLNTDAKLDPLSILPYSPPPDSPAIDAGDPSIIDVDMSRSDMGMYGGPQGCVFYWLHVSCSAPERVANESWPHQFIYSAEHIVPIDNKEQPSTYLVTGKSTYNELIVKLVSESGETIWSRAFAGETLVYPPLIGDLTGDDRADIVVGTSKSTFIFQQNTVSPYVYAYSAAGTTSNSLSLSNVDQEDAFELLMAKNHLDSSFGIYNWRDNTLKNVWGTGSINSTEFSIPASGDIDADGDAEVVIGVMDEPGVSPNWDTVLTVYDHIGNIATASARMEGMKAREIKLADLDGDSKKEILLTTENKGTNALSITVFDHLLQPLSQQPITESVVTTATPADLDYDGTLDLIYSPKKGELKVVDHQGNVRPGWPVALPNISTKPASPILVGNTDAHLQPEIIASTDCAPVVYSVWGEITQTIDEACGASSISLGESEGKTALFYTLPNKSAQFTLLSGNYHDQTMLWPIAGGNQQRNNTYAKLDYPTVSPLPTPIPTNETTPNPTPLLRGDIVEPWGVVDSFDLRKIIDLLFGSLLETGDLNDDGQIDIFDFNIVVSDFIQQ